TALEAPADVARVELAHRAGPGVAAELVEGGVGEVLEAVDTGAHAVVGDDRVALGRGGHEHELGPVLEMLRETVPALLGLVPADSLGADVLAAREEVLTAREARHLETLALGLGEQLTEGVEVLRRLLALGDPDEARHRP